MAHVIGSVSIPKSAYSIIDVAHAEKISDEKIRGLMRGIINILTSTTSSSSKTALEDYFNNYGCKDTHINLFSQHSKLRAIAPAIKISIEESPNQDVKKEFITYFYNFYISKKVYIDYKKHGKPYFEPKKMLTYGDLPANCNRTMVGFPKDHHIFEKFSSTVVALGLKKPEAILMALEFFMRSKPEIFGEIESKKINENMLKSNYTSYVYGNIDKIITNKVWKAIQRYNAVNSPAITFSEFLESALKEKLERLPLYLVDPELNNDIKEIKAQENGMNDLLK